MIRGFIDFDTLDLSLAPSYLPPGGSLRLPGFELEYDQNIQLTMGNGKIVVVCGHPRPRDAALAQRLAADGWQALLPGLLADPAKLLQQLSGRFSLLWADLPARRIGLSADRFNTFGFCYAREGARLSFSDRADKVPSLTRKLSSQAIFDYFYFHVIPAPVTIFEGVSRLEPGGYLMADEHGTQQKFWWVPHFAEPGKADFDTNAQRFKSLIKTAVERDLDGSPVGAFLSGGTDSSTVVGMLGRSGNPVTAYSIGFEAEGYDEMEYARIAARHFGVKHVPYYITCADLVSHIPHVAAHYDQPFGNSSVLPAHLCARLAHDDGHSTMFAGDGGDELFGGNSRYAKQRVFGYYDAVPGLLKNGLLEPVLTGSPMGRLPLMRKAASYIEQARTPLPDRNAMYNLILRLGIDQVFERDFLSSVDTAAPLALQQRVWRSVDASGLVNRMLGFDWRFTLADNDLPKVIGSTQLAGVNAIFPLIDDDLLDFSLGLPADYKLKGLKLRWFFKEALKDFLPPEIIVKKKQGFGLPFGHWLLKDASLQALARGSLEPLVSRGIMKPGFIEQLFSKHLPAFPGYYGEMVWISMMLGQWLAAHANSPANGLITETA